MIESSNSRCLNFADLNQRDVQSEIWPVVDLTVRRGLPDYGAHIPNARSLAAPTEPPEAPETPIIPEPTNPPGPAAIHLAGLREDIRQGIDVDMTTVSRALYARRWSATELDHMVESRQPEAWRAAQNEPYQSSGDKQAHNDRAQERFERNVASAREALDRKLL